MKNLCFPEGCGEDEFILYTMIFIIYSVIYWFLIDVLFRQDVDTSRRSKTWFLVIQTNWFVSQAKLDREKRKKNKAKTALGQWEEPSRVSAEETNNIFLCFL